MSSGVGCRAVEAVGIFLGDEAGGQFARTEARMLHDGADEIDIMAEAFDFEAVERGDLQVGGFVAGLAPGDQLGDHRVVEHGDLAAFGYAIVDADAVDAARRILPSLTVRESGWSRGYCEVGQLPVGCTRLAPDPNRSGTGDRYRVNRPVEGKNPR